MAAIADLSDLLNRLSGGSDGNPENVFIFKTPRVGGAAAVSPVAGRLTSLWRYEGVPSAGAVPGAGAIPTRATAGAIPFTPAGGGRDRHLIGAGVAPLIAGVYLLYDRLFHAGGFSGVSTAAQIVQNDPPSPALTRNTGGAGNMMFYEIYSQLGTTGRTLTVTYTNQDGTPDKTTTINIGGSNFRDVARMHQIPYASGDTGVRAVKQVQLDASTGTAGDFGITIGQPLAWIPVGANGAPGWRDWTTGLPGIPVLHPDACLALAYVPTQAVAIELVGFLSTVEA